MSTPCQHSTYIRMGARVVLHSKQETRGKGDPSLFTFSSFSKLISYCRLSCLFLRIMHGMLRVDPKWLDLLKKTNEHVEGEQL
jgi:hypothetical protein